MTSWQELKQELDLWQQSDQTALLWWRDDDADQPSEDLQRLIKLSSHYAVPVGLAASPALIKPDLADFVAEYNCVVLQHGYAHVNHAPADQKKCELGDHRPLDAIVHELAIGSACMREKFDDRFVPVMVPPWNRIEEKIIARLSSIGFIGISAYTPRHYSIEYGLKRCNTHLDIVDWRGQDGFIGVEAALGLLVNHLASKRSNRIDCYEPTGLLTHHQRHNEQSWRFIEELLAHTCSHPAIQWLCSRQLFG